MKTKSFFVSFSFLFIFSIGIFAQIGTTKLVSADNGKNAALTRPRIYETSIKNRR